MTITRSFISRTLLGAALLVALFVAVLPSNAELISYSITCTSTTMNVSSQTSGGSDFGYLTVTANGVEIASLDETSPYGEDAPYTVTYSLPAGDYDIVATWTNKATTTETVSASLSCGSVEYGRICFAPGEVASSVYLYPDTLEIYSIAGDEGVLSISQSTASLYKTASSSAGDVVIATADDVLNTVLYRQIDGNFRVVVGPEPVEGKTYECVFNVACSKTRSWLPGKEPYGWLDLSDCTGSVIVPVVTPVVTPDPN